MTTEHDEEPDGTERSGSSRALVLGTATVVVLILGAAIGMLITRALVNEQNPPSAESIDVGFAQDMRVHHLQAVTMAGVARDRSTDSDVRTLAFDIESTQLAQSSEMTGWLTSWGQPELPPPGRPFMTWMTGSSGHAHSTATAGSGVALMPGMATSEEISQLKSLSGKELDTYFMQLTLRHHQGALPMAQYTAQHASVGYVRSMAEKIVTAQSAEVQILTRMLAERSAVPLPAPN